MSAHLPVFLFDLDTLREAPGARPCYLIGPFDDFDAMQEWMDANDGANDGRLSLHYQPITLPDASGRVPTYTPEQAAKDLPVLHEEPEAKARFERWLAIQTAMERAEERHNEFLESHDMPLPTKPN
jgi:hypothetical protein